MPEGRDVEWVQVAWPPESVVRDAVSPSRKKTSCLPERAIPFESVSLAVMGVESE